MVDKNLEPGLCIRSQGTTIHSIADNQLLIARTLLEVIKYDICKINDYEIAPKLSIFLKALVIIIRLG